jgi:hypothetical protein
LLKIYACLAYISRKHATFLFQASCLIGQKIPHLEISAKRKNKHYSIKKSIKLYFYDSLVNGKHFYFAQILWKTFTEDFTLLKQASLVSLSYKSDIAML